MSLTVFLVDDEVQIVRLLTRVLSRAGHQVFSAENGDIALEVFSEHADEIDVMVLDIIIPPAGAEQVLDHVLPRRPGLPFLLVSGDEVSGPLRERLEREGGRFLHKPFRPATILEAIEAAISAKAEAD
ncbi:MAG: response regulator [Nitrospinota bacterium]|nr:response regulator [Nitrospinota bacterium]